MPAKRLLICALLSVVLVVCLATSAPSLAVPAAPEPFGQLASFSPLPRPEAGSDPRAAVWAGRYRIFPKYLFQENLPGRPAALGPLPSQIAANLEEKQQEQASANRQALPVLADSQILAFYGKPGAQSMGILGEYTKEELAALLEAYVRLYDGLNGQATVQPAFYIIYGTCWPEGEIGFTSKTVIEQYIQFAQDRDWLVFLDHQIGRYSVEQALRSMLPFLHYPNVHLALDPEWRTLRPMKEIGTMSAVEFNNAQRIMNEYLAENRLPGVRMLIVHQFHPRMLTEVDQVVATYDRVMPIHVADGIGSPALKRHSYAANAKYANLPLKGFKLFFESKVAGASWDKPLMTPEEVLALEPRPVLIMYQ